MKGGGTGTGHFCSLKCSSSEIARLDYSSFNVVVCKPPLFSEQPDLNVILALITVSHKIQESIKTITLKLYALFQERPNSFHWDSHILASTGSHAKTLVYRSLAAPLLLDPTLCLSTAPLSHSPSSHVKGEM